MKIIKPSIQVSLLASLVTVACVFFIPLMVSGFSMESCSPDGLANGWCQNKNTWLIIPYMVFGTFTMYGIPMSFGAVMAILHRRQKLPAKLFLSDMVISIIVYYLPLVLVEMLLLEPWKLQTLENGVKYNAYSLDAIYGTLFAVPFVLMILFFYIVTHGAMALWTLVSRPTAGISDNQRHLPPV